MNQGERITAREGMGAQIARGVDNKEVVVLTGRYDFNCYGPVAALRAEYVGLRDELLSRGLAAELDGILAVQHDRAGRFRPERFALDGIHVEGYVSGSVRRMLERFASIPQERQWIEDIKNLVVTVGKNDLLDKYLAGSGYTAAFYLGLISSTSYTTGVVAGDTMGSHGGWTEAGSPSAPTYSQATRPAASWAAAAAGSKATASALAFSITGAGTVKGGFLTTNNTKGGTTGILFSGGLFTGGDKVVGNGDTVNATYTLSV